MMIAAEVSMVVIFVPLVIVFDAAVLAIPVSGEELTAVMAGSYPTRPGIRRTRPVSVVPLIVSAHRIPVAIYPEEIRPRCVGSHSHDARGWRRSDSDAQRDLRVERSPGQKQQCEQFVFHTKSLAKLLSKIQTRNVSFATVSRRRNEQELLDKAQVF